MKIIFSIAFLLLTYGLYTKDTTNYNKYPIYEFDEISISDSRTGIELHDFGKQIEIITEQEISQMPVNSVDELLRIIPGVEVQSRGMYGTQADISMRGGTYNQTLILLDGIRIGDPMTGHFNSNLPISLSAIERIEVIKGASSAIYGADAVGGVINIVTKNASSQKQKAANSTKGYDIGLSVGQFSTYGVNLYANNRLSSSVNGDVYYNHIESYGYPAFNGTHNYGFNIHTSGASFNLSINEVDFLAFRLAGDYRDFDARYYYTASSIDKSKEQVNRLFGQSKLVFNSFEGHSITANLGLIYTTDDFMFNPEFTPNSHKTISGDLNIHDKIDLAENTSLTLGSELQFNNMNSKDRGDREQQQIGLYAIGNHNFSTDFNINAGLRGEYLPTKDWVLAPTFGVNYYLTDGVKMRANAGRSIRTPDYTERYVSTGFEGVLPEGRNLGNPDLQPEISWNYEAGADLRLMGNMSLKITGYLRDSKNIIDYGFKKGSEIENNQNLNPEFNYLYAQNLAQLKVSGVEFKINGFGLNDDEKYLNWYLGGNVLDISVADDISSKYITNAAGLNFSAGIFYNFYENFKLSADGIYRKRDISDEQSIEFGLSEEYFVMDTKITYSLDILQLEFTVKNIFDKQYSDILRVQLPGRWMMLGLSIGGDSF